MIQYDINIVLCCPVPHNSTILTKLMHVTMVKEIGFNSFKISHSIQDFTIVTGQCWKTASAADPIPHPHLANSQYHGVLGWLIEEIGL